MFPVIQLGPLALQTPGLILLIGIWIGLSVCERYAQRLQSDANTLYNLVLIGLVAGILGARLGYAIQNFSVFIAEPLTLFSLTATMLNTSAGLVAGVLAAFVYGQRKKLALWPTLDGLTPGLGVFMVALHLSHLASGDAFGTPTQLPWAIQLWGEARHPVQIYEALAALGIFFLLLPRKTSPRIAGVYFWTFTALSALARLFLDFFRGDATTFLWNIHIAQLVAWLILSISLWQLGIRNRQLQNARSDETRESNHVA